jgi:hypothetical protein
VKNSREKPVFAAGFRNGVAARRAPKFFCCFLREESGVFLRFSGVRPQTAISA